MDINIELYKVFYYVAKELSFSEASKKLFISQSAVSQSIRSLEKKLNTTLFNRNTRSVVLTDEGELLFQHIEPAIHLIAHGQNSLMETQTLSRGKLHIGASDTICKYYLIPYLKTFHQLYENVNIKVTNRTSTKCVQLLANGLVDMIITNLPNEHIEPTMVVQPVKSFEDVFIANPVFQTLSKKDIEFRDLIQHPILMLEKNTSTSEYLYQLFENEQLKLQPAVELGSIDLLVDLARIGLGISFVPRYCLTKPSKDLMVIETKKKLPKRQLAIVTNDHIPQSLASKEFMQLLLSDLI